MIVREFMLQKFVSIFTWIEGIQISIYSYN